MTEFQTYFYLGFKHIIAWDALDHLLFVAVLSILFDWKHWKSLLVLITAFTIGHSITLMLATFNILNFPSKIVEMLIPLTIIFTAIYNFFDNPENKNILLGRYLISVLFGFIHGFAFSNLLKSFFSKTEESITLKLLAFNVGLEVGQILALCIYLTISSVLVLLLGKNNKKYVNLVFSALAILLSFQMFLERI
jgi:hypothetical protein